MKQLVYIFSFIHFVLMKYFSLYNYIYLSILYMHLLLNYTFFSDIMLKTVFKPIWIICFCVQGTIQQNIFLSDLCSLRYPAYSIFRSFFCSHGIAGSIPTFCGTACNYNIIKCKSLIWRLILKTWKSFTKKENWFILLCFSTVYFHAVEKGKMQFHIKENELYAA